MFVRQVDAFGELVGFVGGSHVYLVFIKFQIWCRSHYILNVNILGEGIVAFLVAQEGKFDVVFTWSVSKIARQHWHCKFCRLITHCHRRTVVLGPSLYHLTGVPVFLLYISIEHKHIYVFFKPIVIYLRCGHLHVVDGEWSSTCVGYGYKCIVHCTHLYQWVGVIGALVANHMLYHDVVGPLRCCSTGNLYIHREYEIFATRHVGGYLQVGIVAACHAFGVYIDSDIVGFTCGKRQFHYRSELYGAIELEHTFGQQDALRTVDIRNAGETERCKDDGIGKCTLVLEAERAVLLKDELIANTHIHRVAIFDERDYGAVFGYIVERTGCLGLVH